MTSCSTSSRTAAKPNGFSGDMQAWSNAFEDPEIKDLVAYVRTFCKK
jgi:mono/diheme cytochrome c family protein